MAETKNPYQLVTDRIVAALEADIVPWKMPWTVTPHTSVDGHVYRGINVFLLGIESMVNNYESTYWGTYDAIKNHGGQVKKGQRGTLVTFWNRQTKEVTDSSGAPVYKNGKRETKTFMLLRYYRVWNVEQCAWKDGLPDKFKVSDVEVDVSDFAAPQGVVDSYLEAGGPTLTSGDRAAYSPRYDTVTIPAVGAFDTPEHYYGTLFHELTHSTGHASRLNREGVTNFDGFGTHTYGKEELVAEMGAAMLCSMHGLDAVTHENTVAYIKSWLDVIKGDEKMVVQAAGQAQRAVDMICGVTWEDNNG